MAINVLHMADMHLEWPFAGLGLDSHRARLRREELKDCFVRIIDLALREQVDVLLIAGDLFEHAHVTRGVIHFLDQQFQRIERTRVFISAGNHDPLLPDSYYLSYPWSPNVHIFGPEAERVDLPDLPVSVYGWGFPSWEVRTGNLQGLRAVDPSRVNLVVVHGGDELYHPFQPSDLAGLGADYIALGHIHKTGTVLAAGDRVVARYSGSPEGLSFGEPGVHGVYLGTVEKGAARWSFVPTGRREYRTIAVAVDGAVAVEDLISAIRAAAPADERREHCFRLVLTGSCDSDLVIDTAFLTERLQSEFFLLRLENQTTPAFDLEALARERSARGLFVQRLLDQLSRAAETEAGAVRRAIALGLAAFEGKGAGR